jgi:hypothetical protein
MTAASLPSQSDVSVKLARLLSRTKILYAVIGPPFVTGSDHEMVTKSRVQVVVGAEGLLGGEAASTESVAVNSPYPISLRA